MAYTFPQGTKVFYSNTLAAAKTITSATNASPAVATSVAHGYTDADPVLYASSWADANDTVFEVDQLTADTFSFLNLAATDTNVYPVGSGMGTTQKLSGWTEVPQILSLQGTGGGVKYGTIDPLGSRQATKQPIGFEAAGLDIKIGYDASNVVIQAMQAMTRVFGKVAIKLVLPGGGRVYGYGNIACNEFPEIGGKDAPIQLSVGIGFDGRAISYGA
jgi:hypothetical protein